MGNVAEVGEVARDEAGDRGGVFSQCLDSDVWRRCRSGMGATISEAPVSDLHVQLSMDSEKLKQSQSYSATLRRLLVDVRCRRRGVSLRNLVLGKVCNCGLAKDDVRIRLGVAEPSGLRWPAMSSIVQTATAQ